ncbi:DEAD/DEAH box helicase [Bdellovibrionota bacterium FG-2]
MSDRKEGSWPLSVRVRDAFEAHIRNRGEGYFQAGQVRPTVAPSVVQDTSMAFSVRGTQMYVVRVDWGLAETRNEMLIHCSCPYYAGGLMCKHGWAVILTLDDQGVSSGIAGRQNLTLRHAQDAGVQEKAKPQTLYQPQREPQPEQKIWLRQLRTLQKNITPASKPASGSRTAFYRLDLEETRSSGEVVIEFYQQETLQTGSPGAIKHLRVARNDIPLYAHAEDRELMSLLLPHSSSPRGSGYYSAYDMPHPKGQVPAGLQEDLLRKMALTGRLFPAFMTEKEAQPFRFDEGEAWRLLLQITKQKSGQKRYFDLSGFLVRGMDRLPLSEPMLCLRSGLIIFRDCIARLEAKHHFGWIMKLRDQGFGLIPESDGDELVEALCTYSQSPQIEWPTELQWRQEKLDGTPSVVFTSPPGTSVTRGVLADLRFTYSDKTVSVKARGVDNADTSGALLDKANRRMILRIFEQEQDAFARLASLEGLSDAPAEHLGQNSFRAHSSQFPGVVKEILTWGWKVEAHGRVVRPPGKFKIKVSSGVDWFDLDAKVAYSQSTSLGLPALIAALERGESLIPLGDGTLGMLPVEWLKKYAPLASLGDAGAESYRFTKSQGALLGAWLSNEQGMVADPDFLQLMKDIAQLGELKPKAPTRFFQGELRSYQKEGLSWLDFLRRLGFGGILADDMGLGKTIQVLAHLESEYTSKTTQPKRPSLVILPKSLLFNWQEEAARFTPKLRVLAYAGQARHALLKEIPKNDLVLVTYPILRVDFQELQKFDFHYIIADEAQAIKNAESLSHKACCLMRGSHRLVMTGTPVENSINDLFALLDFVSPGLLGRGVRGRMARAATHGKLDTAELEQLAQALKPFILRRTKAQVLKDLPEKTEKVLHCELSAPERKYYLELRDYYREHLRGEIERRGIARSKIIILEALLRLRQAACHRGLIDKKRIGAESTKVDTLLAQLQEVISEGHKALVFSQFTSFLDIIEKQLMAHKIEFRRLDGQTSSEERRQRVTQFQEDPALKVFLVSLKAGGVGLNLTAANYVFILDPWWNPAAETQAIDRTHRIGQKNKVIAYRLIAKDTVEEKILELQQSKRALADAIITADTSLLRKMTAQDLEVLLS